MELNVWWGVRGSLRTPVKGGVRGPEGIGSLIIYKDIIRDLCIYSTFGCFCCFCQAFSPK